MHHHKWIWVSMATGISLIPLYFLHKKEPGWGQEPSMSIFGHMRRYIITRYRFGIFRWSQRIYGKMGPRVYRIGKSTILKCGRDRCAHEPDTMLFVQRHTSIPIPKLYDYWPVPEDEGLIMLMERVEGRTLEIAWPDLTHEDKLRIFAQLKGYVDELRAIQQPRHLEGVIGTWDGGPLSDALLSNKPCGSFKSDLEFNEFMISRFEFMKNTAAGVVELEELRNLVHQTPRRTVLFTHSDIMPRNIILDPKNDIASILDWEMAGWRPEQWEYLKSMWMGQYDLGWPDYVPLFLEAYEKDLELHTNMWEMHGSPF
ncbi:kinase-like domain-containing protein [Infundibulicybe gibba]|nr:kinase-like domain-containing protein [Infundibulicybe gibba]